MEHKPINRRDFLRITGLGFGAAIVAACAPRTTPTPEPTPVLPTDTPPPPLPPTVDEAHAIVGDVIDFALQGDWPGTFGFVRFRLHEGFFNGERVYYIRTDASDPSFAEANDLVFVPLLNVAQAIEGLAGNLYLFDGGNPEQLPILSTDPSEEEYSPLWRVHQVIVNGNDLYNSEESLLDAAATGDVSIEPQDIFVNYPVVKWTAGEMSVDAELAEYLGGGQLVEPIDVAEMSVTFKLHECFPSSRYIVTDTSAAPMAPMMSVLASSPLQVLAGENSTGTDKIWVFANGIQGSGVMGFQPAIFGNRAGEPTWSPLWNHFTLAWNEGITPRVLRSADDVNAALEAGEVEQFNGTPDTHPEGFIVNCSVPVLAPNNFTG